MNFTIEFLPLWQACAIICCTKILEISIQSVKTVCMVKGHRVIAALLAFVECMIWGLVVSSVITSLNSNTSWLISYCLGYAAGIFIGSLIESKIALGTSNLCIMVPDSHINDVENYLRDNNRGFTILKGHGSKEFMSVVIIILPRKDVKSVIKEMTKITENKAFVITLDVSNFTGGYGIRK